MAFRIKPGADVRFLQEPITSKLWNVEHVLQHWGDLDSARRFRPVITSGRDGSHKQGSKHYEDLAIDVRIWYRNLTGRRKFLSDSAIRHIMADLEIALGEGYDIVWHRGSHLHIEADHD